MNDLERLAVIAGIQKVASSSALMQIPAIAASYAALVKKGAPLQTSNDLVAADQQQLKADEVARDIARSVADGELITLKTLVSQAAQNGADVAGMGFKELASVASATQDKPAVPGPIVAKPGKTQGRARVMVGQPGRIAGHTMAELSPDPIGAATWVVLPGSGKQRKLSGYASGTRLWVRFAAVKYGQQSDWTTPVLVIIP